MERVPFRRLVSGPPPAPDRILFTNLWFRGHNNPRYAELLPRLDRLDRYLVVLPESRIPRGVAFRALWAARGLRNRLVLGAATRRYRFLFTADNEQIPHFPGKIVSDVDDPRYTPREVAQLNAPNVEAYVVTAERAARRFEELGVRTPWYVIPQGVSLSSLSPERVREVGRQSRRDGEVVVGHMAAWLLAAGDRGGENPLYNVDHLLELWDEIHPLVPSARLWLIGGASDRVRERLGGRDDVLLFGRLAREEALAHAANFDVALYARTADQGIQAAKVAEYMGLGVPTVSYDYRVTEVLRETGAGLLVPGGREFVDAVVGLAGDEARRAELAAAARRAGAALDWDALAERYEREILDVHLR
jgi:glycosyltransferase involved in cell wall biosynthesis